MQDGYIIETKLADCQWIASKKRQGSVGDAQNAVVKMSAIVRGRRLSGLYQARIIPASDKNWKRLGIEPRVIKTFDM